MSRIFALIPAAGRSRRMRTHKLLLPVGDRRVIDHLVDALTSVSDKVCLLCRKDDLELQRALTHHPEVLVVDAHPDPPEMRDSVELLLEYLGRTCRPEADDACILCPADHPVVHQQVLKTLIRGFRAQPGAMHLPTCRNRSGHPLLMPWAMAQRVHELPAGKGVNTLKRLPDVEVVHHPVDDLSILWDLDTPEDYQQLLNGLGLANG